MNPITHFLAGWTVGGVGKLDRKGRAAVALAGVLPDLDGLGILAEKLTEGSARPLTWWSDYHHVLAHNLFFGLLVSAACFLATGRNRAAGALALASFHLHILGDIAGAGGPGGERWPIPYLWPFSDGVHLSWAGQWPLDGWQNFAVTALLLGAIFAIARRSGTSPLELFSARANAAFVETIRRRFP